MFSLCLWLFAGDTILYSPSKGSAPLQLLKSIAQKYDFRPVGGYSPPCPCGAFRPSPFPQNVLTQRMMKLCGSDAAVLHTAAAEPAFIGIGTSGGLPLSGLGQYRTNELVRRRMNFSSDAMADFEGLLEVNRKICQQQMAEKASPTLPTNCAVLP